MDTYILDTNLFFNMAAGIDLGQKTEDVVKKLTENAKKLKDSKQGSFIMPPRIVDEFLSFFEDKEQPFLKEFLSQVTIKSPNYNETTVSANVVYQLVEDIRARSYRGLTVAEEEIQNAGSQMLGQNDLNKKDFQIKIGSVVKNFRNRYRQATRFGFLDSLADLDLIMLAKETDGYLVSTDEGVVKWGRVFGVKELPAHLFGQKMRSL
jgi:RNA ligase partner protein